MTEVSPKFDLYDNEEYNICLVKHLEWEEEHGEYYRSILCLKSCKNTGNGRVDEFLQK